MPSLFTLRAEERALRPLADKGDESAQRQLAAVRRKIARIHDSLFGIEEGDVSPEVRRPYWTVGLDPEARGD